MMRTKEVVNMKQEIWIDNIKLFACFLVAMGHFFMSMVESGILPDSNLHKWFVRTIYYFHVPLFFMCSGYLYQTKSYIRTVVSWKDNVIKKAVTLGVPYFLFSIVTWILKNVFSDSVNIQNEGLLFTLFLRPSSPYWYLYTLFFLFIATPTLAGRKHALMVLLTAILLKYVCAAKFFVIDVYAINQTLDNFVWFVCGMCMSVFRVPIICKDKKWKNAGLLCCGVFIAISFVDLTLFLDKVSNELIMGLLGCLTVFLVILNGNGVGNVTSAASALSKYTMPVYLMHTIFAAGIRAVLMKLQIVNPVFHVIVGLSASFVGPVMTVWILEQLKLDFVIYPSKYWKWKSS